VVAAAAEGVYGTVPHPHGAGRPGVGATAGSKERSKVRSSLASRSAWLRAIVTLAFALTVSGCDTVSGVSDKVFGPSGPSEGQQGFVQGYLGGAVADDPRATLVARDILSAGGNAADAAVALGLVRGFLERFGASRFEPVTRRGRRASAMPPIQDQAGYVRRVSSTEDEYLFSPIVFRTQVAKELDANFVLKSLEEHGYLNKQGKNRTVSTKIFGQPKTLYSVSSRILEGA